MELIKSFFAGTIAFGLLFVLWLFYDMENLVKKINDMDMIGFGIRIVMVYLVFLAAYLMITYIIYNRRYTKGRKKVKEYYNLSLIHILLPMMCQMQRLPSESIRLRSRPAWNWMNTRKRLFRRQ